MQKARIQQLHKKVRVSSNWENHLVVLGSASCFLVHLTAQICFWKMRQTVVVCKKGPNWRWTLLSRIRHNKDSRSNPALPLEGPLLQYTEMTMSGWLVSLGSFCSPLEHPSCIVCQGIWKEGSPGVGGCPCVRSLWAKAEMISGRFNDGSKHAWLCLLFISSPHFLHSSWCLSFHLILFLFSCFFFSIFPRQLCHLPCPAVDIDYVWETPLDFSF